MRFTEAVLASLLTIGVGALACVVWDRFAVRAAQRRHGRLDEASIEELMHPGDDCAMGGGLEAAPAEKTSPPAWLERCACGHIWLRHDVAEFSGDGTAELCCVEGCDQNGCPGRARMAVVLDPAPGWRQARPGETPGQLGPQLVDPGPTLREETIDVPTGVPLIPLERLYDAGGMVKLGRNILHDHCLFLRREGRYREICAECRPSLVGYAADLPHRTEP